MIRSRVSRNGPAVALAALAILANLMVAPQAGAEEGPMTLGPNLAEYSPDNTATCATNPFSSTLSSPGATSCTWVSAGADGQAVPGPGTITQVAVKTGATSGQMRAVVMRAEAELAPGQENIKISCCTGIAESQTFEPTVYTTTTIPVNLTTELKVEANKISFDLIGLSVLEPGVPVPAATNAHERIKVLEPSDEEEGPPPRETEVEVQPISYVEQPAMVQSGALQPASEGKGELVLMDLAWQPAAGFLASLKPATPQLPTNSPGEKILTPRLPHSSPAVATMSFPARHPAEVHGKRVTITLDCAGPGACAGRIAIQSQPLMHAITSTADSPPGGQGRSLSSRLRHLVVEFSEQPPVWLVC